MRFSVFVFSSLLAVSAFTLSAQTTAAPTPQNMMYVHAAVSVRPGMEALWESTAKKYCAAAVKGGAKGCDIYSTLLLGNVSMYYVHVPLEKYELFDGPPPMLTGSSRAEFAAMSEALDKASVSTEQSTVLAIGGLSIVDPKPGVFFHVTTIQVKPGMQQMFFDDVEKLELPAAKAAGLKGFYVYKTLEGGSPDTIYVVTPLDKFADLDKPNPIFAAMSKADYAKFQEHTAKYSDKVTYTVIRYRPDLSAVVPAAAK